MEWKKLLLLAGGAAGAAALLYYVLNNESAIRLVGAKEEEQALRAGRTKTEDITKEQVLQIMQEIIKSQEHLKGFMKGLSAELRSKQLSFEETYARVKDVQPTDPLEKYGLSMTDFDQLLDRYHTDPGVREAIAHIMGAPTPSSVVSEKVESITVRKILEVHQFMFEELERLEKQFQTLKKKGSYDMKTVTIAAQAVVGSKVEERFGITTEEIESAVLMYHTVLATDQDFANINVKIQHTMGKLMGNPFSA
eukprot:TRINITY_DN3858_c0_g2_i1.p1 TRINITY_DN3858_c0_g2~~TRINITY_DN3858_c0_g2_i1.p1  ORF type:complete len:251 (+),score=69.23 TRINITY_DN3858_c0_g2_i1:41-793(+)